MYFVKHIYKCVFTVDLCLQLILKMPLQALIYSIKNCYYNKLFVTLYVIFYRILMKMLYLVK